MVNPSDIVAALVALLRAIPDLVDQMGGDEERIYGYEDIYPQSVNLQHAIETMESPSVMVAYLDWGHGVQPEGSFDHRLAIFIRPAADSSYADLTKLLVDGVPTGSAQPMIRAEVLSDLYPMRVLGRCSRVLDSNEVEYWSLNISLNEIWG